LKKDEGKIKEQPLNGTEEIRQQVTKLKASETEYRQEEDKVKQTVQEWSTTFNAITDLVSIFDKEYKIIRANKAFADTFRKKPGELIGKSCYEVVHGTNEPVANCPLQKTIKTRKPVKVEFFEPHLGIHLEVSTSPIFNEQSEVVAVVHLARDITERKQMENKLKESEENFRNSVAGSPLGIVIGNKEGDLIYANQAMLDISGYSSIEELKAVPEEQRYTPQTYAEQQERRRLGKPTPANLEVGLVCKSGDGEKRFQALYQDITERRKLEEQQKLLIKELRESLANVKTLSGLLPMCAWCRKLRDDKGYWLNVEQYISTHTLAEFTHSICPECEKKYFSEYSTEENSKENNNSKVS
jgi:PAS domain S-box-containing protein